MMVLEEWLLEEMRERAESYVIAKKDGNEERMKETNANAWFYLIHVCADEVEALKYYQHYRQRRDEK